MPCFPPCRFLEAHSESQGEESTSTAARLLRLAIDNMKVGMARWLCLLVCLCLSDTIGCAAQITVTNVHIRYEDSTSHPATPFAVGLTMDRFAVSTTNERGEAVFVNRVDAGSHGSPSTALLHKAASITDLGLYAAWRWLRPCCAGALLLLPSCVLAGIGTRCQRVRNSKPSQALPGTQHLWLASPGHVLLVIHTFFAPHLCAFAHAAL